MRLARAGVPRHNAAAIFLPAIAASDDRDESRFGPAAIELISIDFCVRLRWMRMLGGRHLSRVRDNRLWRRRVAMKRAFSGWNLETTWRLRLRNSGWRSSRAS